MNRDKIFQLEIISQRRGINKRGGQPWYLHFLRCKEYSHLEFVSSCNYGAQLSALLRVLLQSWSIIGIHNMNQHEWYLNCLQSLAVDTACSSRFHAFWSSFNTDRHVLGGQRDSSQPGIPYSWSPIFPQLRIKICSWLSLAGSRQQRAANKRGSGESSFLIFFLSHLCFPCIFQT